MFEDISKTKIKKTPLQKAEKSFNKCYEKGVLLLYQLASYFTSGIYTGMKVHIIIAVH